MKDEKRQEICQRIQKAVDFCIIAQDWLSLERMYSRVSDGEPFDRAVSVMFGDMLVAASDTELVHAAHVADFILSFPGRIPWRTGR